MRARADGALGEAPPGVVHDEIGVDIELGPEPVAGGASAERVVEREQPRLDLRDRKAGDRAGKFRGEDRLLAGIGVFGDRDAIGELEGGLERIREAVAELAIDDDAVDDDFDVVLQVLIEPADLVELKHLAVDLDALKAAPLQLGQFLAVFALAAAHDRRQQVEPGALRHRQDPIDHLRHRLADDRQSGGRRIGHADARPQQPHIVIDLGHRANRRARVARGRLLLDRDRRRQPFDRFDLGLLHQFEELPGISRLALDITALPLGIDRVEGERGLAGPREAGDHDEAVTRQVDIDVLEIVLARAADPDQLLHSSEISAGRVSTLPPSPLTPTLSPLARSEGALLGFPLPGSGERARVRGISRHRTRRRFARSDDDVEFCDSRSTVTGTALPTRSSVISRCNSSTSPTGMPSTATMMSPLVNPAARAAPSGAVDWMRTPVSRMSSWKRTTRRGNGAFCPATPI